MKGLIVDEMQVEQVIKALRNPTRYKILFLLGRDSFNIKEIAEILGLGESNISTQIRILEIAGLVNSEYKTEKNLTWKFCSLAVDEITLKFRKDNGEDGNG
jgi:predicted transcriptional regulator